MEDFTGGFVQDYGIELQLEGDKLKSKILETLKKDGLLAGGTGGIPMEFAFQRVI